MLLAPQEIRRAAIVEQTTDNQVQRVLREEFFVQDPIKQGLVTILAVQKGNKESKGGEWRPEKEVLQPWRCQEQFWQYHQREG